MRQNAGSYSFTNPKDDRKFQSLGLDYKEAIEPNVKRKLFSEREKMSRYAKARTLLPKLKKRRQAASGRGISVIGCILAILAAAVSIFMFLVSKDPYTVPILMFSVSDKTIFLLAFICCVLVCVFGTISGIRGRAEIKKLDPKINKVREILVFLEGQREALLTSIRNGELDTLPSFKEYVFPSSSIDLLPDPDQLVFHPQKGEICFTQISNVPLGRFKTYTKAQKVGGGYRIGKTYIPVKKERVRITEMDLLDRGTLAITNHRILYLGKTRKLSTKFNKILQLQTYQDALAITKEGRQSADFYLAIDGELLSAIIDGIGSAV